MIPTPAISFFMKGESFNAVESLCVRSFQESGHQCYIYSYHKPVKKIKDCHYLAAQNILAECYWQQLGTVASNYFESWFRWELSARNKTWVATADFVCQKPLIFTEQSQFACRNKNHICDELFFCNKKDPFLKLMLRRFRRPELFFFDSLPKSKALLTAIRTLSRYPLRLIDAEWLNNNDYLSALMIIHPQSQFLLPAYAFCPLKSSAIQDHFQGIAATPDNLKMGEQYLPSYAIQLFQKSWQRLPNNDKELNRLKDLKNLTNIKITHI